MLTLSIPRKIKVCYSCCFKLQIPNLVDQESFLFALFLFSRAHLLSSKMEDKLLVNLLQTSYAPASAERCWWGLLTATLQTEGGPVLCQHSWLCTALCLHHSSSCPCMSHKPHAQKGYSLQKGYSSLTCFPLLWKQCYDGLPFTAGVLGNPHTGNSPHTG